MIKLLAAFLVITTLMTYISYRFIRLPPTIGVMVTGLLFSLGVQGLSLAGYPVAEKHTLDFLSQIDFESVVMEALLPFLLFAGALHVKIGDLKAYRWPVGALATGGVVGSTFAIGTCTYLILPLFDWHVSYLYCLLFAAACASTDPIACGAALKTAGAPVGVRNILIFESLANDGTSIAVFTCLAAVISLGTVPSFNDVWLLFLQEAGGGVFLGIILGYAVVGMMKSIDQFHIDVMLSLSLVVGGAVLASLLHASAPMAMVVAGLIVGNLGVNEGMSKSTRDAFVQLWEVIDEVGVCVLFCLIGIELLLLPFSALHIVAGVALSLVVIAARFMTVAPVAFFKRMGGRRTVPRGTVRVLTWGGLRGGVSVALALTIPAGWERDLLLSLTYTIVVISILCQGLTIGPLVSKIYGSKPEPQEIDPRDPVATSH